MKKAALLLPAVLIFFQLISLSHASESSVRQDIPLAEAQLDGVEAVGGKVRLRIEPARITENPRLRLDLLGGDNWTPLENIDSWADYDGKAVVGVKDEYGRCYVYAIWRKGSSSDAFRRYDVSADKWEYLTSPTDSGLGVVKNGVCMAWDENRYIYVVRGGAYSDYYRDFWRYDIRTDSWEVLENTPWYQGAGDAIAWVRLGDNEYIYAVIGTTSSSASAGRRGMVLARFNITAWNADPDNDPPKWEVIQRVEGYSRYGVSGTIPYGCDDGSSIVWTRDNYLYYLVGAYNETLSGPDESHFLRYHLIEKRWEELAPIPYNGAPEDRSGVDDGGSIVWPGGNYIYAIKGGDSAGHVYADNFYRYNIITNTWEKLANLPEGVGDRNGRCLASIDGKIYFLRVHGSTGFWRYNPPVFSRTKTFTSSVIDAGAETVWGEISLLSSNPSGFFASILGASGEPALLIDNLPRIGLLEMWYPASHVVISEFATRGPENAYQEFIEIYNPTSSDIDLSGWKIQYRSSTGTTWYDRVVFPSGATIRAFGFYLAVNENGYPGGIIDGVAADAAISSSIADSGHLRIVDSLGNVVDAVSYGTGHNYTEEGDPAPNHGTSANNGSVERKAIIFAEAPDMLPGGMYENAGNACDTDNNASDFIVRSVRNPQNSASQTEAPPPPSPRSSYLQTKSLDGVNEEIYEQNLGCQAILEENQENTVVLFGENTSPALYLNEDDSVYYEVKSGQIGGLGGDNAFIAYYSATGAEENSVKIRGYDGSAWDSESELPLTGGRARWVRVAYCPLPERAYEKIVVALDENGYYLDAFVWNGSSWAVFNNIGYVGSYQAVAKCFDIAYEENTGRALLVYATTTSRRFRYRIWDGQNWSQEYSYDSTTSSGYFRYMQMASKPGASEIALVATLSGENAIGLVWNGNSWGNEVQLWYDTENPEKQPAAVAYESQSGYAMFVVGEATDNLRYRRWLGTGWEGAGSLQLIVSAMDGTAYHLVLKSDPASNNLMLGILDGAEDLNTALWDGSSWTVHSEHSSSLENDDIRSFDLEWEPAGGRCLLVYDDTSTGDIKYKVWDSASGWSSASSVSAAGADSWIQLRRNPNWSAGEVMIFGVRLNSNYKLGCLAWDGAALTNLGDNFFSDNTGTNLYESFELEFQRVPTASTHSIVFESTASLSMPVGASVNWIRVSLNFTSENAATYYLGVYNWQTDTYLENFLTHSGSVSIENDLSVTVDNGSYLSSDNRIRVRLRSSEATPHRILADRLLFEVGVGLPAFGLRWEYVFTGLENTYENVKIRIFAYAEPQDENIVVSIWNASSSLWENRGVLPATASELVIGLPNIADYLVGENLYLKMESEDNADGVQTRILVDRLLLEASEPYSSSVSVWVRVGSDNDPTDEPSPPENWTDWFAVSSGQQLNLQARYLQYRAELSSTDERVSPTLEEVEVEHLPQIPRTGILITQPLQLGYVDSWGVLDWIAEVPSGTSVDFLTRSSPDGFLWSDWEPLSSGWIKSPVYNCRYLQVKAILQGFGSQTPTLEKCSILYSPDRTPPQVDISEPKSGFLTREEKITVRGRVSDSNPVRVEINGVPVIFEPGTFEKDVKLNPGQNVIRVVASDAAGNKREVYIRGIFEAPQPQAKPEAAPVPPYTYFIAAAVSGGIIIGFSLYFLYPTFVKATIRRKLFAPLLSLCFFLASPALISGSTASVWSGTWSSRFSDFRRGMHENTKIFTSGVLALEPSRYWGNDFAASYYYTDRTNLDSPEKMVSIRFVAQSTKTLQSILVYLYQTGGDLTWRFRLELDDGSGKPSGVLAWQNAWQTAKITSSKWWTIDLLSPGLLRGGSTYHLVISWENSGTPPSPQDLINIRSLWPFNSTWINGITTNDGRGVLIFDGSSWRDLGREPVYILKFSDGTYEGNPYYKLKTDASEAGIFGENLKGERFYLEKFEKICGAEIYARRSGAPADNLYLVLLRGPSAVVDVFVGNPESIDTGWGWAGAIFDSPLSLSPGQYVVALKSPGATSEDRYDICVLGTYSSAPHPNLTFSGTTSCFAYSTNGGITWTTGSKMQDDVPFRFIGAFKPSGAFTSEIFDAGNTMRWERLSWRGSTPAGTSVQIQTRSSQDNIEWSSWEEVGEDGSVKSPPGRYLQYRILLFTQNELLSPSVSEVQVSFSDASPPEISFAFPAMGQTVSTSKPTVEIVLGDISGINGDSIILKVDGSEVEFSYDHSTKTVRWTPERALSSGEHEIWIRAADAAGNYLENSWTFLVSAEQEFQLIWLAVLVVVAVALLLFVTLRRHHSQIR